MDKEKIGLAVAIAGALAFVAALVKFTVIGYYPDELPLWAVIGLVGGAAFIVGQKVFVAARNQGD